MKVLQLFFLALAFSSIGLGANNLIVNKSLVWKNPENIPVCFEAMELTLSTRTPIWTPISQMKPDFVKKYIRAREVVKDTLRSQFSRVKSLQFTGFSGCPEISTELFNYLADIRSRGLSGPRRSLTNHLRTNFPGLRILIRATPGKSSGYGEPIRGIYWGVEIGFQHARCGENWENCLRHETLHEVGHALGLAHEHERFDAPSCKIGRFFGKDTYNSRSEFNFPQGSYDPLSIMNYCANKHYETQRKPVIYTDLDIDNLDKMYSKEGLASQYEDDLDAKIQCVQTGGKLQVTPFEKWCCDRVLLDIATFSPKLEGYSCRIPPRLGGK